MPPAPVPRPGLLCRETRHAYRISLQPLQPKPQTEKLVQLIWQHPTPTFSSSSLLSLLHSLAILWADEMGREDLAME